MNIEELSPPGPQTPSDSPPFTVNIEDLPPRGGPETPSDSPPFTVNIEDLPPPGPRTPSDSPPTSEPKTILEVEEEPEEPKEKSESIESSGEKKVIVTNLEKSNNSESNQTETKKIIL